MIEGITNKKIKVFYFSDPVCSTCWMVDPYIKKLVDEYGTILDFHVKMGGLMDSFDRLAEQSDGDLALNLGNLWDRQTEHYGVLMDGSIWRNKPISSSIPASVAFFAVLMQSKSLADKFIRIVREMLFLQNKDVSEEHHLIAAAIQAGVDIDAFREAMTDGSAHALFEQAQDEREKYGIQYFPTLVFINSQGIVEKGMEPVGEFTFKAIYESWEAALFKLTNGNPRKMIKSRTALEVLKKENRVALSELVVLCSLSEESIKKELSLLIADGLVVNEKNGPIDYYRYNSTPFLIKKNQFKFDSAAIIGGGVCGNYLSFAMNQAGKSPIVLERLRKESFRGLGFLLLKNGIDALDAVGLKNELYKRSNSINCFKATCTQGNEILRTKMEDCLAISRDAFFDLFYSQNSDQHTVYEKTVEEVVYNKDGGLRGVTTSDNEFFSADIFLASDGIRSKIRQQFFEHSKLEELPERELVGTVYLPELDVPQDEFHKVVDQENGKYMGMLPLGDGHYIWFMQINNDTHPVGTSQSKNLRAYAIQTVKNYPKPFQQLIASSDFDKVFLWFAHRMEILPSFHYQNMALLGDAAHPLLAFTSQGANAALEDAAYLLTMLSNQRENETIEEIYQRYYEVRKHAIQHHINEGDALLDDFLNMRHSKSFKLPLSIH